jgi:hypothetical protein
VLELYTPARTAADAAPATTAAYLAWYSGGPAFTTLQTRLPLHTSVGGVMPCADFPKLTPPIPIYTGCGTHTFSGGTRCMCLALRESAAPNARVLSIRMAFPNSADESRFKISVAELLNPPAAPGGMELTSEPAIKNAVRSSSLEPLLRRNSQNSQGVLAPAVQL